MNFRFEREPDGNREDSYDICIGSVSLEVTLISMLTSREIPTFILILEYLAIFSINLYTEIKICDEQ